MEFVPRFIFINTTDKPIVIKQVNSVHKVTLPPNKPTPFYFWLSSKSTPKLISLRYEEEGWEWYVVTVNHVVLNFIYRSPGFVITELSDFKVKLKRSSGSETVLAGIEIKQDYATTKIYIRHADTTKPPYRIVNNTNFEIQYGQKVNW